MKIIKIKNSDKEYINIDNNFFKNDLKILLYSIDNYSINIDKLVSTITEKEKTQIVNNWIKAWGYNPLVELYSEKREKYKEIVDGIYWNIIQKYERKLWGGAKMIDLAEKTELQMQNTIEIKKVLDNLKSKYNDREFTQALLMSEQNISYNKAVEIYDKYLEIGDMSIYSEEVLEEI